MVVGGPAALIVLFAPLSIVCRPHATHWKGGAGLWHPHGENLPKVPQTGRLGLSSNASLIASPEQLSQGSVVNVRWSGIHAIGRVSWIGVYSPSSADSHDFLDYVRIGTTTTEGYVQMGPLVNMRYDYEFRFFTELFQGPAAISNKVQFIRGTSDPLQGRLALTGNPDEMRVTWVSDNRLAVVQFGLMGHSALSAARGTSHTYNASDMCGPPATTVGAMFFRDPGYMHDVLLTGLQPREKYRYRFGDGLINWSDWFWFTSARPLGDPNSQVNMFAFGDLGEWRNMVETPPVDRGYTTMWRIEQDLAAADADYDLLLHVGDVSYARGQGYQWEQFGRLVQPTATRIPYHVCIGNHEYDHEAGGNKDPSGAPGQGWHPSWGNYDSDSEGECAVPMVNRFHMPDSDGNGLFWYSHEYANIHFTWISTEHNFTAGSPMYIWLEKDLASVNRSRTPWLFLMGHRPMYASVQEDDTIHDGNWLVQKGQREAYESLLYEYGVDVFLAGHYHSYERTCPVFNGTCHGTIENPQATVHLLLGMAGATQDKEQRYIVPWSRNSSVEYGYVRLSVANSTHLHVQYVQNEEGNVYDDAWVTSDHTWHQKPKNTN